MSLAVLHLAPHPDDELIGAPATLMALRDAGHRVVNLACSLGSADQRERRRDELAAAMHAARFEYRVIDPPVAISRGDDLVAAEAALTSAVGAQLANNHFDLVVSPSPHDGHHGHELVGRVAAAALAAADPVPRWWLWGLWADLPFPTLFVPFGEARLNEIQRCLGLHREEIARSDYRAVVEGRSRAARVLGVERVFGYGEPRPDGPCAPLLDEERRYAEVLTEVIRAGEAWWIAPARMPDFGTPLAGSDSDEPIGWWLREISVHERRRRSAVASD